jgi:hypothetical protein
MHCNRIHSLNTDTLCCGDPTMVFRRLGAAYIGFPAAQSIHIPSAADLVLLARHSCDQIAPGIGCGCPAPLQNC